MVDVGTRRRSASCASLRRQMQMIFQDPFSSLNPRMTVFDIVGEPLLVHGVGNVTELEDRVVELLRLVGPAARVHAPLSACLLAAASASASASPARSPSIRSWSSPTSRSRRSTCRCRRRSSTCCWSCRRRSGSTYLFVAHDLSVVKHISERVAVMYVGRIVETASTEALFATPQHPYTEALLSAVPKPDPRLRSDRIVLQGEVADPANPPPGCHFHPRCQYAQAICSEKVPLEEEIAPDHFVRCHRARELTLRGVAQAAPG